MSKFPQLFLKRSQEFKFENLKHIYDDNYALFVATDYLGDVQTTVERLTSISFNEDAL